VEVEALLGPTEAQAMLREAIALYLWSRHLT
jgi:hypothetical protein